MLLIRLGNPEGPPAAFANGGPSGRSPATGGAPVQAAGAVLELANGCRRLPIAFKIKVNRPDLCRVSPGSNGLLEPLESRRILLSPKDSAAAKVKIILLWCLVPTYDEDDGECDLYPIGVENSVRLMGFLDSDVGLRLCHRDGPETAPPLDRGCSNPQRATTANHPGDICQESRPRTRGEATEPRNREIGTILLEPKSKCDSSPRTRTSWPVFLIKLLAGVLVAGVAALGFILLLLLNSEELLNCDAATGTPFPSGI